jgi:hypothetical protein
MALKEDLVLAEALLLGMQVQEVGGGMVAMPLAVVVFLIKLMVVAVLDILVD